jgi:thiamine biosynthesis lipoprotein
MGTSGGCEKGVLRDCGGPPHAYALAMRLPPSARFGLTLLSLSLLAGIFAWILPKPPSEAPVLVLQGKTMGTSYEVKIVGLQAEASIAGPLQDEIELLLFRLNQSMSHYIPDSEISRFNRSASTEAFAVSTDFRLVLQASLDIHRRSGGAFDPTLGPLIDLWGFGPGKPATATPTEADLAAVLARTGADKLRLTAEGLSKSVPDLELNLSAIAKGYGVDRVSDLLAEAGHHNTYVEIGGEVRCRGVNAIGIPWRIGVQNPKLDAEAQALRVVSMHNRAMATSGDYRNIREMDGVLLNHILDPRDGKPVGHLLASVSVLAEDCMTADAVATALIVMGREKGMAWLANEPGLEACFIERIGEKFTSTSTPGFEKTLVDLP